MKSTLEIIAQRLAHARRNAGFESRRGFARFAGVSENTYDSHEAGRRSISIDQLKLYANLLSVDYVWLMFGDDGGQRTSVGSEGNIPLVGYIGAGLVYRFNIDGPIEMVQGPPSSEFSGEAITVRGDSMSPAFRDGDLLFYDQGASTPIEMVKQDCVLLLENDVTVVRYVERVDRDGRAKIVSYNGGEAETVRIVWGARISWVKRA